MKDPYMRKTIVVCLASIMALCVLVGCGAPKNYEVLIENGAGEPVSGVTIQFCSDTDCNLGKTDEKGIAVFDKEAGAYTIHLLKVPEGYATDDTEYTAPAEPGRMTIVLK